MIPYFPKQISQRAILVYLASLTVVSIVFMHYSMQFGYIVLGCFWVIGFFLLVCECGKSWRTVSDKRFRRIIFFTALSLRIVWVIASYYFFIHVTGQPLKAK